MLIDKFNLRNFINSEISEQNKKSGDNNNASGGQEQIIAMIRVLLRKNADIYIFDESTSALDPNKKKLLMQELKSLAKNKIVVFIVYDLPLVQEYCSKVVFAHDMKFTLSTHKDLLKQILIIKLIGRM
jgi:ABC-type bacteriocin/lantibiotic exporter with double-glycine peptidase domain